MLPNRAIVAAAFAIAALALPIRAARASLPATPSVPRLAVSGPLRAGETVDMEWAPLGAGAEELELLLSLDGGRTWPVRVSPELPGESVRYRWRVPNLAAADARVRLRVRVNEREIELPASEAFAIESDPTQPLDRRLVSEGSWWNGFEDAEGAAPELGGHAESSLVASRVVTASEETPRVAGPSRSAERGLLQTSPAEFARATPAAAAPAVTRNQPLRM
jgi:hypothetical protein